MNTEFNAKVYEKLCEMDGKLNAVLQVIGHMRVNYPPLETDTPAPPARWNVSTSHD